MIFPISEVGRWKAVFTSFAIDRSASALARLAFSRSVRFGLWMRPSTLLWKRSKSDYRRCGVSIYDIVSMPSHYRGIEPFYHFAF